MNSFLFFFNRKKNFVIAFLFLFFIFLFRLLYLDSDMPSWGLATYTSGDEGTYSALALTFLHYGQLNIAEGYYQTIVDFAHRNNVIGNLVTYFSLILLGDNYWGLRLPSFLWIFASLLIFCVFLYRKLENNENKNLLIIITLFLLITSFPFYIASRIVEPSCVRLFFVLLVTVIFLSKLNNFKKYFLSGFFATISVTLVYVTNIFLFFPFGIILLLQILAYKFKNLFYFIFGVVLAFIISESYYYFVWDTSFIINAYHAVSSFSKVSGYQLSSGISSFYNNFRYFIGNNYFFYHSYLFFFLFFSIPVSFSLMVKGNKNLLFLFLLFLGFFIQTMVSADYVQRKFLVILPECILLILFSLSHYKVFYQKLFDNYFVLGIENIKLFKSKNILFYCLIILIIINFLVGYWHLFTSSSFSRDVVFIDRIVCVLFFLVPLLYWGGVFIKNKRLQCIELVDHIKKFLCCLVFCSVIININFIIRHVHIEPTFGEKNSMLYLKENYKEKYLIGEWSYGYTLYNDIKPIENSFEKLSDYLINDKNSRIILYAKYSINPDFVKVLASKGYRFVQYEILERYFTTMGVIKPFALYGVEKIK